MSSQTTKNVYCDFCGTSVKVFRKEDPQEALARHQDVCKGPESIVPVEELVPQDAVQVPGAAESAVPEPELVPAPVLSEIDELKSMLAKAIGFVAADIKAAQKQQEEDLSKYRSIAEVEQYVEVLKDNLKMLEALPEAYRKPEREEILTAALAAAQDKLIDLRDLSYARGKAQVSAAQKAADDKAKADAAEKQRAANLAQLMSNAQQWVNDETARWESLMSGETHIHSKKFGHLPFVTDVYMTLRFEAANADLKYGQHTWPELLSGGHVDEAIDAAFHKYSFKGERDFVGKGKDGKKGSVTATLPLDEWRQELTTALKSVHKIAFNQSPKKGEKVDWNECCRKAGYAGVYKRLLDREYVATVPHVSKRATNANIRITSENVVVSETPENVEPQKPPKEPTMRELKLAAKKAAEAAKKAQEQTAPVATVEAE